MKKLTLFIVMALCIAMMPAQSRAALYTFQPTPPDLYDLDHTRYYSWGINWFVPDGEIIDTASLFFNDIRNWATESNDLWGTLLDNAYPGVYSGYDNEGGGNFFASLGEELFHWEDISATPADLTYNFTLDEVTLLSQFLLNGNVGLGFDPDCHFLNNGITFSLTTSAAPVPEPSTMLLLGAGLVGMVSVMQKRRSRSRS